MPNIDPRAAVANAVCAWAGALSGIADARRGFPEHHEELDLTDGPVITYEPIGELEREDCTPAVLSSADNGDGTLTSTYRVGRLVETARLDLWVPYRAQRDQLVATVEAALEGALPVPGLWLTADDYYSRPITVHVVSGPRYDGEGTGDSAVRGEWRASWGLEIHFDRVQQVEHTKLTQVDLALSTEVHGETTTETVEVDLSGA